MMLKSNSSFISSTRQLDAFTLIELLVVISIISILISILLPALSSARNNARAIQCASNQRGVGIGISLYTQDNKDFYPTSVIYPKVWTWTQYVGANYLSINNSSDWSIGNRPKSIFACPSSDLLITGGTRGDYGINWHLSGDDNQPTTTPQSVRQTDLLKPGKIILTADAAGRQLIYWGSTNPTIISLDGRHKQGLASANPKNVVNVMYADNHVAPSTIGNLIDGLYSVAYYLEPWKPE